jgi:hypothetical protein
MSGHGVSRLLRSCRLGGLMLGIAALALVAVSVAAAQSPSAGSSTPGRTTSSAPPVLDDDLVLPSRVLAAIDRLWNSVERSEGLIDDAKYPAARLALKAVRANVGRAHRAGVRQMSVVPADEEAEAPGPPSVIAILTYEQAAVARIAGLFDTLKKAGVVYALRSTLRAVQVTRDQLVNAVVALDPEGAGADYADGMVDTVPGYADEVANLTEALQVDRLTPSARTGLTRALARAKVTEAKINAAYGGGD